MENLCERLTLNPLGQKHIKENLRERLPLEYNWRSNWSKDAEGNMKLHGENKAKKMRWPQFAEHLHCKWKPDPQKEHKTAYQVKQEKPPEL